jgi:hypothetical protein
VDLLDHAAKRGGNVHRGLVGLQGDQRVFGGHGVADRNEDLDHRYVVEVSDVGDLDVR